jgi:hypothetical protein
MIKLFLSILIFIALVSCETEREKVTVGYEISDAYAQTEITYRNNEGSVVTDIFNFESTEDVWNYHYTEKRGEIVYISARYTDSTSSINVRILVDGKVYKQGSSVNEPNKYTTVSGTIPY